MIKPRLTLKVNPAGKRLWICRSPGARNGYVGLTPERAFWFWLKSYRPHSEVNRVKRIALILTIKSEPPKPLDYRH